MMSQRNDRKVGRLDPRQSGGRNAFIAVGLVLVTCAAPLACTPAGNEKASHFEHDHEVAEHWPVDLNDLAEKLRSRLEKDIGDETKHEIEELVSWVGEVAADTDLAEADWSPLYHRSEAVTEELNRAGDKWSSELLAEIRALCDLIDTSAAKLSQTGVEREVNPS